MKQRFGLLVLKWLRFWARLQLRKYAPDIIGITGSAGKTSCRNAVKVVLKDKYQLKVTGKANSESGIPLDILDIKPIDFSLTDWLRMCLLAPIAVITKWKPFEKYVVEMGIDSPKSPKNMEYLLTILQPRTAIFLNASLVHSQNFDHLGKNVRQLIAREKGKLIQGLPKNGLAILNADQAEVAEFANKTKAKAMFFGAGKKADIRLVKVERDRRGTKFTFKDSVETAAINLPYLLPNYYGHTLGAALCINADEGNMLTEGCQLLEQNFQLEPGRMSVFEGVNGSTIIDSSYNASAEPTIGALQMLEDLPAKRRLAVLGQMNELGQAAEAETKRVKAVAEKICDQVWWSSGDAVADEVKQSLRPGDFVLIKGSQNGVFLEMTVERLLANAADATRLCRRGIYWDKQRKTVVQ
jgi:UDP-N-acetylmuramoyl-tripeptide--D-alanyl-D-alanine ligase